MARVAVSVLMSLLACGGGGKREQTVVASGGATAPDAGCTDDPSPDVRVYKRCDGVVVVRDTQGTDPEQPEVPDQADVMRKVQRAYVRGVQRCYHDGLKRDATLEGKLSIKFTLLESGDVTDVVVVGFDAGVDACVAERVKSWRFDGTEGKPGPIELTFAFRANIGAAEE